MQDDVETTWDEVNPGSPAHEKAMAAAKEWEHLNYLAWPSDLRDVKYACELMQKPDRTAGDVRYAHELIGEVADRLREARDFPEKRERERWQKLQFAVAVSAGKDFNEMLPFFKTAYIDFSAVEPPKDESDLLAVATWTMASLLDVLTSDPAKFAGVQEIINAKFREMFPGVRRGRIVNGQLVLDPEPQVIPFPQREEKKPPATTEEGAS